MINDAFASQQLYAPGHAQVIASSHCHACYSIASLKKEQPRRWCGVTTTAEFAPGTNRAVLQNSCEGPSGVIQGSSTTCGDVSAHHFVIFVWAGVNSDSYIKFLVILEMSCHMLSISATVNPDLQTRVD